MSQPRQIIIDCDPGQDDAIAILLALASPEDIKVLGITTVGGNVPLEWTSRNALAVCALAGQPDVPVFGGCRGPMLRKLVTAEHVHGATGLEGPPLPAPSVPLQQKDAVDFIIDTLRAAPSGTITLCALGPLTNIAAAFQRAPDIAARVSEIVLMGGARTEGGNVTPAAEFNIHVDPHAAGIVFASGAPLVVMPLDVTHKALTSRARVSALRGIGNEAGRMAAEWAGSFERFDKDKYGGDGAPLHDPCVIAYLIRPDLFAGRHINVEIETESELTMGMTVADWWGVTGKVPNTLFMNDLDAEGFFALLIERIARL